MAEQVSAQTKQRILDAAVAALETQPMMALQISEIAERAQVSASSLYKAYANKYELFAYAAVSVLSGQVQKVAANVDESQTPVEVMRQVLAEFYRVGREHPFAAGYLFLALPLAHHESLDEDALGRVASVTQLARGKLEHRITAAIDAGQLRGDPEVLTEYCLIASLGYLGVSLSEEALVEPEDFADMTMASLQALGHLA